MPDIAKSDPGYAALSRAADSHGRALGILFLAALFCFLPGQFSTPVIDRDEARYAQASKQMMESGEYVDIRFHTEPRYKQPAGIYWLQVAAAKVTGYGVNAPIWVYRLPSLLGAVLVVLLTYWVVLAFASRETALLAGLFMATCILLGVEARLAKTDAMLNACILAAQGVLVRAYLAKKEFRSTALPVLFWVTVAAGTMIKGPILPFVIGLTAVAASIAARDLGWLRRLMPLRGLLIALVLALPWYVAIGVVSDGEFYRKALGINALGKVVGSQESHGAPPGLFIALIWVTFWPAVGLLAAAIPWIWGQRARPEIRFLLAWILPAWIGFELFGTKLPHYVLPLYPAIAALVAMAVMEGSQTYQTRWARILFILAIPAVIILPIVAVVALGYLESGFTLAGLLASVAAIGLAWLAFHHARSGQLLIAWLWLAGAMVPLYFTLYQAVFPKLDTLWTAPRLAAAVSEAAKGCDRHGVLATDFREASLIFSIGTDIRFGNAREAADFVAGDPCNIVLIGENRVPEFNRQLDRKGLAANRTATVTGFDFGKPRLHSMAIYRAERRDAGGGN